MSDKRRVFGEGKANSNGFILWKCMAGNQYDPGPENIVSRFEIHQSAQRSMQWKRSITSSIQYDGGVGRQARHASLCK